jgi:transposase-like protein
MHDHRSDYPSLSAACREIGGKLGCSGDSLHDRWKQARRDAGTQPGPTTAETARIRALVSKFLNCVSQYSDISARY